MSRFIKPMLLVTTVLATAACSTARAPAESTPATTAATTAATQAEAAPGQLTGSRIPRKSSDRMVRGINAAGAKETFNELPPSSGPKIN